MEGNIGIYDVSKHGQTRKIAHFLGDCFRARDWDVYVTDLGDRSGTPEVSAFSAVLIGAPVYMERYPRTLRDFIAPHRWELAR
jgi:menaquinone-dependent protoporphyrinogen IX oxidase